MLLIIKIKNRFGRVFNFEMMTTNKKNSKNDILKFTNSPP